MTTVTILIIAVVVIFFAYVISIYNRLVKLNVRTNEAWSDIDVQLKRRYDLIPNLIETVKGYAKQEKEVFENVTKARSAAINAEGIEEQSRAENQITQALKSVFAVAENYPDLKSSANFAKLQDELTDTENKIQASRRFYNANVRDMNIAVQTFPSNVIASMFGFKNRELFELEETEARKAPKVDFDTGEKK